MKKLKWGIIGCGGIAKIFVQSLRALPEGELLAGASRTAGRATAFANEHDIERAYDDYESLVADPDVDVIYVANTHNFHFESVKLCLENGKHVLCEKPFTINTAQAKELFDLAREKELFLMEAVWTRFLPAILKMSELLAEGIIGDVLAVKCDFCIDGTSFDATHRLRNKELAGGALLDLGIYPITLSSIVFGTQPTRIQSSGFIGDTGVDDRSFYLLDYEDGRTAQLSSSYSTIAPIEAIISGSEGYIRIPHFLGAQELHIHCCGEEPEILHFPYGEGENFKYEIAHVMECISAGKTESEIMTHAETLSVLQTMDTLRAQWGLTYPNE